MQSTRNSKLEMTLIKITILEIKKQLKFRWIAVSLIIQASLLVPIYWLLSRAKLGNPYHLFFLSEAFLILFIAPITSAKSITQICKKWRSLSLSPIKSIEILLGSLISGQFYALLFLVCSSVITAGIVRLAQASKWHISFSAIVKTHFFLIICIFTYGAIAILCALITKELLSSIALTHLITAFFIGGVVLATPLKYHMDNLGQIKALLLNINPIIAVCGAVRLDIFRTQYLYEIAPIGSSVSAYPAWYTIGLWHFILMIISLGIASTVFRKIMLGGNK